MNTGRWADVIPLAQAMSSQWPGFSFGWAMLGAAHQALGQSQAALIPTEKALKLSPEQAEAHSNLGNVLQDLGRDAEAVVCFKRAVALKPDFMPAHYNLANALSRLGQYEEAIASYDNALAIEPRLAEAQCNAASALLAIEDTDAALQRLSLAVEINPGLALAHRMMGELYQRQDQTELAWESLLQALKLDPKDVAIHRQMSSLLGRLKRYPEATHVNRAWVALASKDAEAHRSLGQSLRATGQLISAVSSFEDAIRLDSQSAQNYVELGLTLNILAEHAAAQNAYGTALKLDPSMHLAYTNMLFAMAHNPAVGARELWEAHERFGHLFETPLMATSIQHKNKRDPHKVLQVGFVSPDLRNHALSVLLLPVLEHLGKASTLCLHAYYTHHETDIVTAQVRSNFRHWHDVAGLNDAELAQKIREDGIDVLIDLSGHTAHNRLLTFARKPAPVQISWLGYPGTTGLRSMDYYLADTKFVVPNKMEWQFSEKIIYLPATYAFPPSEFAPAINDLPALKNGYMTFGSFNRPAKIGRPVVALWADLMRNLPTSRIIFGGVEHNSDNFHRLIQWFSEEKINEKRLTFLPRSGVAEYLGWHHSIDICLDTFPYNGGTTSANALTMGVPTLTIAGDSMQSRAGAQLMSYVRLNDFVASDEKDFVKKGIQWMQRLPELAVLRHELRNRLNSSPIGQSEAIANSLESTFRTTWENWCLNSD